MLSLFTRFFEKLLDIVANDFKELLFVLLL